MKPFLFFIAGLFAAPAFAQDNHDAPAQPKPAANNAYIGSELILSHGFLPTTQIRTDGSRIVNINYSNETHTGAIAVTYRRHISRLISLGVTAVYAHEEGNWSQDGAFYNYYGGGYNPGYVYAPYYGTFRRNALTIAPEITFNYCSLGHGLVNMYAVLGLGYTYRAEKFKYDGGAEFTDPNLNPMQFNMYAAPFGVRLGRQLSGFFELGVGYKGVISYGLTYRF